MWPPSTTRCSHFTLPVETFTGPCGNYYNTLFPAVMQVAEQRCHQTFIEASTAGRGGSWCSLLRGVFRHAPIAGGKFFHRDGAAVVVTLAEITAQ